VSTVHTFDHRGVCTVCGKTLGDDVTRPTHCGRPPADQVVVSAEDANPPAADTDRPDAIRLEWKETDIKMPGLRPARGPSVWYVDQPPVDLSGIVLPDLKPVVFGPLSLVEKSDKPELSGLTASKSWQENPNSSPIEDLKLAMCPSWFGRPGSDIPVLDADGRIIGKVDSVSGDNNNTYITLRIKKEDVVRDIMTACGGGKLRLEFSGPDRPAPPAEPDEPTVTITARQYKAAVEEKAARIVRETFEQFRREYGESGKIVSVINDDLKAAELPRIEIHDPK
jgi:hypothetical protein